LSGIVAMVETVWVLDRAYRLAANEIAAAVERMLQTDVLVVENEQEVFSAMIALKEGQGSFADAIIAALGTRAGCSCTLTFDQKALRLSVLSFLESPAESGGQRDWDSRAPRCLETQSVTRPRSGVAQRQITSA